MDFLVYVLVPCKLCVDLELDQADLFHDYYWSMILASSYLLNPDRT